LTAGAALSLVSGCQGCHDGKPYTPYHLGDGGPAASASGSAAPDTTSTAPVDAGAFSPLAGRPAEGSGAAWTLGDASIAAPVGRKFSTGLEVDVDRDGKPDLLAWSKSADGLRGELVFAAASAPAQARTVFALPGELAPAGCTAKVTLSLVGPRSAVVDFRPACPAVSRDRAIRYVAIARWPDAGDGRGPVPELGLELRVAQTDALDVVVTTLDKDGDGRPDIVATFTTRAPPKPLPSTTASASLVFFDRAAGLSRDPGEPETAFKAALAELVSEARRPRSAAKVAGAALALRRLADGLCEESGGGALVSTSAGPVRCGDEKIGVGTTVAELEAAVNSNDPVAAAAALARVEALGASGPRKKDVDRLVSKALPSVIVPPPKVLAATPSARTPQGFGPIGFLANGDLLVRTDAGVVRADATSLAESADPPRAWSTELAAPTVDPIARLTRVEQRCSEPTLLAHVAVKADGGDKDVELALPIPTPARCTAAASLPVFPLGAAHGGALVSVGLDVVEIALSATPTARAPESLVAEPLTDEQLGAARAPDGLALALPTPHGVLVVSFEGKSQKAKASVWSSSEIDRPSFCVPANGAKRIACVANGKVLVADR
jgi:hypothetical protein